MLVQGTDLLMGGRKNLIKRALTLTSRRLSLVDKFEGFGEDNCRQSLLERERDEKCSWYIINRSPLYVINIFSADSVNLPLGREQVQ